MSKRLKYPFVSILFLTLTINSGLLFGREEAPVKKVSFKTIAQKLERARKQQIPGFDTQGFPKEVASQFGIAELQYRKAIPAKIDSLGKVINPPFYRKLPDTLLLGDFTIIVKKYNNTGTWDIKKKQAWGISGIGWTHFGCSGKVTPSLNIPGFMHIKKNFQVVPVISDSLTQISLEEAMAINPKIRSGDQLVLNLSVKKNEDANLLQARKDLLRQLCLKKHKGILVSFNDLQIKAVSGRKEVGRVIMGQAVYTAAQKVPDIIKLPLGGFIAEISALTITPDHTKATITLLLPQNMADFGSCRRAKLFVGETNITYNCEFYKENTDSVFGPWLIGNSGMIIHGKGFTADFSSSKGVPGQPFSWKGVLLKNGLASAKKTTSDSSNTGYLTADYKFKTATLNNAGFSSKLSLNNKHSFFPVNPLGYKISFENGELDFAKSEIKGGIIGPGVIEMPIKAVCGEEPGKVVKIYFSSFQVSGDLDLSGKLQFGNSPLISWGELTHTGNELLVWQGEPDSAYFYLPAGPASTFVPVTDTIFSDLKLTAINDLDSLNIAGLVLTNLKNLKVYSPDRPGSVANPFTFSTVTGWLRVGSFGVDGQLKIHSGSHNWNLGDSTRFGYVGHQAFNTNLNVSKGKPIFFQYASSAVFNSEINGWVTLPEPSKIDSLEFTDLETSSTANLVGGDLILNVSGDTLDYWKLALVPTGNSAQAGVLSVRTGRILFNAAGIAERIHFDRPFGLTWAEFYADGNIGKLFFNYNTYGQRFDGHPYSAGNIVLSRYIPGRRDGYLATCGTIHFNFFGKAYVNIRDARYDSSPEAPYFKRKVSVPQTGEAGCETTNLHLHADWNNKRVTFDFPDANMKYNENIQEGFIGNGKSTLSIIKSDNLDAILDAFIEIHKYAIDIRLKASNTVDLDFGLFARLGIIGELAGYMRIEGSQLKKISVYGQLKEGHEGLLCAKSNAYITTNIIITPNSITFSANGKMALMLNDSLLYVSAYVRLSKDHLRESVDGEIKGTINCNAIVFGLEGSGQITWHLDQGSHNLQGKIKINVLNWSRGLEGGLFIGKNVPKSKAWVLETGNKHLGISQGILPKTLTGVYGYGQVSFNKNFYVFSGEIQLYAGVGAFVLKKLNVIGSANVYAHGDILDGLVSVGSWGDLDLNVSIPMYFEGTLGLEGCALWGTACSSIEVTAGFSSDGFYMY